MAKKNKIDIELDIADLLGLSEPKKRFIRVWLNFYTWEWNWQI